MGFCFCLFYIVKNSSQGKNHFPHFGNFVLSVDGKFTIIYFVTLIAHHTNFLPGVDDQDGQISCLSDNSFLREPDQ